MSAKVITITREFGSGGRTIGKEVAAQLGYDFYDWELVKKLSEESGFSEEFIEKNGEDASSTHPWLFRFNNSGNDIVDRLYVAQRNLIRELAEKGNCVIVGRCADYILRDRDDVLNVFVWATEDFKKKRVVELYGETADSIEKRLDDKDKRRKAFYQYYTNRKWGRAWYYQVCLESSRLGVENCVKLITQMAKDLYE
jgi:cytidylate kinase